MDSEPLTQYQPGICDVDMFGGYLKPESIWKLGLVWTMTGHRAHCTRDDVRSWIQIASSPLMIWIPKDFENKAELTEYRRRFVTLLWEAGIITKPYTSAQEKANRPQTAISGKVFFGGMDLAVLLSKLDVPQVSRGVCTYSNLCECASILTSRVDVIVQVFVLGYGTKSRCTFVYNPLADVVHAEGREWVWDVGRTVRGASPNIPVFDFDLSLVGANPEGVHVFGMLGMIGFCCVPVENSAWRARPCEG